MVGALQRHLPRSAGRFDEVFAPVVAVQSTARRVRKVAPKVASVPASEGAAPAAAPKKTKRRGRK